MVCFQQQRTESQERRMNLETRYSLLIDVCYCPEYYSSPANFEQLNSFKTKTISNHIVKESAGYRDYKRKNKLYLGPLRRND